MNNIYECIGKVLKYKELCEVMSVKPYTNTAAKKKQIEKWREFIIFEMVGKKFKIIEVIKEPTFQDGRKERGKFSKHLRNIIMSSAEYQDKKYKLYIDEFKLFNNVIIQEPTNEIKTYKSEFDTKISKIFSSVIKSMKKDKLIYYTELYYIKEEYKGVIREAKPYEIEIIMALKNKHIDAGYQSSLKLAINDFNNIFGYYQTWREHYIKVYKPIECNTQVEVNSFRENMKSYMENRMKVLNIDNTNELNDYVEKLFKNII